MCTIFSCCATISFSNNIVLRWVYSNARYIFRVKYVILSNTSEAYLELTNQTYKVDQLQFLLTMRLLSLDFL